MTSKNTTDVKYLRWKIYLEPGKNRYFIRSQSSIAYLDGRDSSGADVYVTSRDPFGDQFLEWEITNYSGEYFSIYSHSSLSYLDGRNGEQNAIVTNRYLPGNDNLLWKFVPL